MEGRGRECVTSMAVMWRLGRGMSQMSGWGYRSDLCDLGWRLLGFTWCGVLEFLLDYVHQVSDFLGWAGPEDEAVSRVDEVGISLRTI